nr:MAG TPA: hypothetical protein [Caudoviricetes sp.]
MGVVFLWGKKGEKASEYLFFSFKPQIYTGAF